MKKKYIIITASCLFLLLAGVCYSYYYGKNHKQGVLYSTLDKESEDIEDILLVGNDKDIPNNHDINKILPANARQTENVDMDLEVSKIYVHLCGAVVNPDVYQVEEGTRLVELIELAGGLIPEAAGDYMNKAVIAEDGQRIYIPTKEELKELTLAEYVMGDISIPSEKQDDRKANSKVNINTAGESELMSLPGIGEAKAKAILDYRSKNGDFKATAELMDIPGIKEGLFGKIEELIIVK